MKKVQYYKKNSVGCYIEFKDFNEVLEGFEVNVIKLTSMIDTDIEKEVYNYEGTYHTVLPVKAFSNNRFGILKVKEINGELCLFEPYDEQEVIYKVEQIRSFSGIAYKEYEGSDLAELYNITASCEGKTALTNDNGSKRYGEIIDVKNFNRDFVKNKNIVVLGYGHVTGYDFDRLLKEA